MIWETDMDKKLIRCGEDTCVNGCSWCQELEHRAGERQDGKPGW